MPTTVLEDAPPVFGERIDDLRESPLVDIIVEDMLVFVVARNSARSVPSLSPPVDGGEICRFSYQLLPSLSLRDHQTLSRTWAGE